LRNNIETEFSSYSVYYTSDIVSKQFAKIMLLRNELSHVDCIYSADVFLGAALRIAAEENMLQSHNEIRLLNCENIPFVKVFVYILLLVKSPHKTEICCTVRH
jgi:hypothetical protein